MYLIKEAILSLFNQILAKSPYVGKQELGRRTSEIRLQPVSFKTTNANNCDGTEINEQDRREY